MSSQSNFIAAKLSSIVGAVSGTLQADHFVWERGNGNVKVAGFAAGGVDTLSFGAKIRTSALQFARVKNDLVIRVANSKTAADGGTITIAGYFSAPEGSSGNIMLPGSATPLTRTDVDGFVRLMTGAGEADVLQGFAGGNDALTGGAGNDAYRWSRGDGNDRIIEAAGGGVDTLELGAGIAASDLSFARSGADLLIRIAGAGGGVLTVAGYFNGDGAGIELVKFGADAEARSLETLIGITGVIKMSGSDGDDDLRGFVGAADVLSGGGGDDWYMWNRGDGNDRVVERANGGHDALVLGQGISAGDLTFVRMGADLQVRIGGANGGIITLIGQYNLGAGVETIYFWEGPALSLAESMRQAFVMGGTGEGEEIVGLVGSADVLAGGAGDDAYRWSRGDGNDRIIENAGGGSDTLRLGGGISASDLTFVRNGRDLQVRIGGLKGGTITLAGQYAAGAGVETIVFQDGSQISVADQLFNALVMGGTAADDKLRGMAGSNDVLTGGAGDDIYVWSRGDGNDRIVEIARGGSDTLVLGAGVKAADLTFVGMGTDLQIRIAGAMGGTITLVGQYNVNAGIETIIFADGSQMSVAAQASSAVVLTGTEYDETLQGFAGRNDVLTGDAGDDTYLWKRGDGNDRIVEAAAGGIDSLKLGAGISVADVKINRVNLDLQVTILGQKGGTISIANYFAVGGAGIEFIVFSDADQTIWPRELIDQFAPMVIGTEADDTLSGFATNDTLVGGAGDDVVSGGVGGDTYLWSRGDGDDVINDGDKTGSMDRLQLRSGVGPSDVRLERHGDDLKVIVSGVNGGIITVRGQYRDNAGIEAIVFDGGRRLEIWDILSAGAVIAGSNENDDLQGYDTNDTLAGFAGDDTLMGGSGDDVYVWSPGDGDDVIEENANSVSLDRLRLRSGLTPSDIRLVREGDDMMIIVSGKDGGVIIVRGQYRGDGSGLELITFDNGQKLVREDFDAVLYKKEGSADADYLTGDHRSDTLIGLAGDDTLLGGAGFDDYVWSRGDGDDVIEESVNIDMGDWLWLGSNLTPSDVRLVREGLDLKIIILGENGGVITVRNQYQGNGSGIEAVVFDDGQQLGLDDILSAGAQIAGSDGAELHDGYDGDDTLTGFAGDDTLSGGSGDDDYVWSLGDGDDVIDEDGNTGSLDRLRLRSGLTPSDVRLVRQGDDLQIIVSGPNGGTIIVRNQYRRSGAGLEAIVFDDGQEIGSDEILSLNGEVLGTDGEDVKFGSDRADTLIGFVGNDGLLGGGGDDAYVWSRGDGDDVIDEEGNTDAMDQLRLGAGLTPSDIRLERDFEDLKIIVTGVNGGTIIVRNQFRRDASGAHLAGSGIEAIVFDDGRQLGLADIFSAGSLIVGLPKADNYAGNAGDDTLIGLEGDDTLSGGHGDDVYVWSRGDGDDVIDDLGNADARDQLRFGPGLTPSDVRFERSGFDLKIIVSGKNGGAIIVRNHYRGEDSGVEVIVFDDGRQLVVKDIDPQNPEVMGTTNDDSLEGSDGYDTLVGSAGSDTLSGGSGDDVYVWMLGDGDDVIVEAASGGIDVLKLAKGISASDVKIVRIGMDLQVKIAGQDGGAITIVNHFAGGEAGLEAIAFSDAAKTTWSAEMIDQFARTITGTDASETLSGFTTSDTLTGGAGDDRYVFQGDFGGDVVVEQVAGGNDTLVFSSYLLSQLSVRRVGNDLRITIAGVSSYVTVAGQFLGGAGIENITAADGTWNLAAILAMLPPEGSITGTVNPEALVGTAANDTINGGGGADTLAGGAGNDVYIWNRGDGHDRIIENVSGGADWLRLNVDAADVSIGSDGDSIQIFIRRSGSSEVEVITVSQDGDGGFSGLEGISFADGTEWKLPTPVSSDGNEHFGNDTDETFEGSAGVDYFEGAGGDDTYIVRPGGDADSVQDSSGSNDRLLLKGIHSTLVTLSYYGDAFVDFGLSSNQFKFGYVAITDQDINGIEQVVFDDGVRWLWNGSDLSRVAGTTSNDKIYSRNTGNVRDEVISGAGGNDVFVFRANFGSDKITDFAATGAGRDTIEFSKAVFADWSSVLSNSKQVGSDVVITASAGNTVTLSNVTLSALTQQNFAFS